jgi:hypothetical protein
MSRTNTLVPQARLEVAGWHPLTLEGTAPSLTCQMAKEQQQRRLELLSCNYSTRVSYGWSLLTILLGSNGSLCKR